MEPKNLASVELDTTDLPTSNFLIAKLNRALPKLILISLQVLIAISVFRFIETSLVPGKSAFGSDLTIVIGGTLIALATAFLILTKFQSIIQEFTYKSDKIEKQIENRTEELLKFNHEMKEEIRERKRIETALAESEARFRTIIKESALGIALLDVDGSLLEWNPAFQTILGYSPEELESANLSLFTHPEDTPFAMKSFKDLLKGRGGTLRGENRYLGKYGKTGWWRQSLSAVRELGGHPNLIIAIVEDVTERKQKEQQIRKYQEKLQKLASELSLTEERERRSLAELLHDNIGQILSFAKIKLEELQDKNSYQRLRAPIMEVYRLIENSIRITRSLIFELSPPILYDVGLGAAVEWLAEKMHKQNGLQIQVECDEHSKHLSIEKRIVLFRAVRELLINVIKHAKATQARVYLRREGKYFKISVEDNGVGFPADQVFNKRAHFEEVWGFGLFSIEERLHYYGGSIEIESGPGLPGKVNLTIPLDQAVEKPNDFDHEAIPVNLMSEDGYQVPGNKLPRPQGRL
jgi:PAS domain S-box-containing protein